MVQLYIICMHTSRDFIIFMDNEKISERRKRSAELECSTLI